MIFSISLLVFTLILFIWATFAARIEEVEFSVLLTVVAIITLASGVCSFRDEARKAISGVYATSESIPSGTYLVRGQFEDPLKVKIALLQGADGKIRAVRVKEFLPPEIKAVEINDIGKVLPLGDPS